MNRPFELLWNLDTAATNRLLRDICDKKGLAVSDHTHGAVTIVVHPSFTFTLSGEIHHLYVVNVSLKRKLVRPLYLMPLYSSRWDLRNGCQVFRVNRRLFKICRVFSASSEFETEHGQRRVASDVCRIRGR